MMKYLRHYLIHTGLCLLLVCSANVAFAQVTYGLSTSTTETSVDRIVDFSVKLNRPLMDSEVLFTFITFFNVSPDEVTTPTIMSNYMVNPSSCPNGPLVLATSPPFPRIPTLHGCR